jgi:nicotinate phosphoribosyltransferase
MSSPLVIDFENDVARSKPTSKPQNAAPNPPQDARNPPEPAFDTLLGTMNVNFAERAHNHNWKLDPIVRSLLDTDFYKLLMLQFIWKNFPKTHVTSEIHNRTVRVRLADRISAAALRDQMEHVRTLRLRRSELVWLTGNTFYGTKQIFHPDFLTWLEHDFRLSDYDITEHDGQLSIRFSGLWTEVTMWEVYSLAIVSEMKTRSALSTLNELELDVLYARAKTRLWDKIELLRHVQGLRLSDFGTRRRHSFLWQEYCVQALATALNAPHSERFTGTSNTALAYKHDLEAIGTNAHELPMAMAALASQGTDDDLRNSQYEVLRLWAESYNNELLILLPDTFGTTQFLAHAPAWVGDWTGERVDSKDPFTAGDEYIDWLQSRGKDPRTKRLIASDGLDASTIVDLHAYFDNRIRFSAGWGTLLTNDFRDCHPRGPKAGQATFDPISLVCKLTSADGIPTVKLSDNPNKSTGPAEAIARYRRVFNTPVQTELPVLV